MLNLVVGAGISGAVIANLIATKLGEKVLIIDKRSHIGGNCFDYRDDNGIMIQKYGSHIFHTSDKKVWDYVNHFSKFNNYEHKVLAKFEDKITTVPFNINSLYDVFDNKKAKILEKKLLDLFEPETKISIIEFQKQNDNDLKELAKFIYDKIFLNYTQKQWGRSLCDLDSLVASRVPVFISKDNRYFQDKYQGIPENGYSKLIENMLENENIQIQLNTDFKSIKHCNYKRIFYSGSIDEFFNYKYGYLPYRSLSFELKKYNKEFYQNNSVVNYTCEEDFTRIHEYKYYLNDKSPSTIIAKEYPCEFIDGQNERFYPIPDEKNIYLYGKYIKEAELINNVYFLGRLGKYKYFNIDMAILDALNIFESRILKEKK